MFLGGKSMKNSEDKKIELNEFFLMGMLAKYLATFITKHIRRLDFEAFFDRNFLHFGIKIPQMLYPVLRASKVFGRLLRAQKPYALNGSAAAVGYAVRLKTVD